jgi:hypothetical protein
MPKLRPATITSPGRTSRANAGTRFSRQCGAMPSMPSCMYAPGASASVSTSSLPARHRRQTCAIAPAAVAHASTSRGSVMRPRSADAATV